MKNAAPNIGFADASFKSCEMSDWGLEQFLLSLIKLAHNMSS